jgi:hypothetical protein
MRKKTATAAAFRRFERAALQPRAGSAVKFFPLRPGRGGSSCPGHF